MELQPPQDGNPFAWMVRLPESLVQQLCTAAAQGEGLNADETPFKVVLGEKKYYMELGSGKLPFTVLKEEQECDVFAHPPGEQGPWKQLGTVTNKLQVKLTLSRQVGAKMAQMSRAAELAAKKSTSRVLTARSSKGMGEPRERVIQALALRSMSLAAVTDRAKVSVAEAKEHLGEVATLEKSVYRLRDELFKNVHVRYSGYTGEEMRTVQHNVENAAKRVREAEKRKRKVMSSREFMDKTKLFRKLHARYLHLHEWLEKNGKEFAAMEEQYETVEDLDDRDRIRSRVERKYHERLPEVEEKEKEFAELEGQLAHLKERLRTHEEIASKKKRQK